MGITRVANVTGLDCIGIPVVMVCRPNARSLAVSQGKGVDLDAARASGAMEAIELYHAERILRPLKLASWNEMRFSHRLARVEGLPRIAGSRFTADHPLLWIEGEDLFSGEPRWLPYEVVHTNFTLPVPTGSGCFVMSSNGLASGNHLFEAVVHGLCELIERDAISLHLLTSAEEQDLTRIDLASVKDPACARLLERYAQAGIQVTLWDATSDVGIATIRCAILEAEVSPLRPLGVIEGMGCHPAREVAMLRALTEAAQGRLTLIAGSRDDNPRGRYGEVQDAAKISAAAARMRMEGGVSFGQTPSQCNETIEEDLAQLLASLAKVGCDEAIAVNLSKPEFGIPVVRVVVPGLETYHHVPGALTGDRARHVLSERGKRPTA
jgi:ribosomal protein S12 methylthiotransferase accessory factor